MMILERSKSIAACGVVVASYFVGSLTLMAAEPVLASSDTAIEQVSAVKPSTFVEEFQPLKKECEQLFRSSLMKHRERIVLSSVPMAERLRIKKTIDEQFRAEAASQLQLGFEMIKPHAKEATAVDPLIWLAIMADKTDVSRDATTLLIEFHIAHEHVIQATRSQREVGGVWLKRLLRAQLASSDFPDEKRPSQIYCLARTVQLDAEYGRDETSKIEDSVALYDELVQKYSDREYRGGLTFGNLAKDAIYEISNLSVGKECPEIEGQDIQGVPFKISDYRGKVVQLTFWASWCGPCMAMVPHERELVKQYTERPFVLIGVNGDLDKETAASVCEKEGINWRSFWNGKEGPDGAIACKWNVVAWPTTFLIDHNGIIQAKAADDTTLEQLVLKAEQSEQR